MKKILPLFIAMITLLLINGCKSHEESLNDGIQKKQSEINTIISESAINEYVEAEIDFEQYDTIINNDKTVFMYNIFLPIKSSYLELDSIKQYELLRDTTQEIFDFQGDDNRYGRPKGMEILDTNGERIKFQSLFLYFDGNKNNTLKISLDNEAVRTFRVDNNGEIENVIFANISKEEYVILGSGKILREGEFEKKGEWAFKKSDSNYELSESNEPNGEVYIDNQTKEFIEWQVKSGEWYKQGK